MRKLLFFIIIFLIVGACVVGNKYRTQEEIFRVTLDYEVLNYYLIASRDGKNGILVLDDPKTPDSADAIAVIREGTLLYFYELKRVYENIQGGDPKI